MAMPSTPPASRISFRLPPGTRSSASISKDLTLARATPDLIYDQMVAAGCARKIIFSYSGNPGVGSLRVIRQEMEAGRLAYEEYSHFAMITRVAAGAAGLPFLPMRPTGSEDLARANPQYKTMQCPYTGVDLVTVPALNPDVAIIHAQRADANGNAQVWGIVGEQLSPLFICQSTSCCHLPAGTLGRATAARPLLQPEPLPRTARVRAGLSLARLTNKRVGFRR